MTVMEFQARRVDRIGQALAHFVLSTREDRLAWRPSGEDGAARSVLEQVRECVLVNRYFAGLLRGETPEPLFARDAPPIPFDSAADAAEQLMASANEVATAIRALAEQDLARTYPHRRGPISGESLIEMPYRNMAYHAGQVNFIQTLYGDSEFHVPPTWL